MAQDTKVNGIKEIAVALGLSLGTIDRALHGRHGVSATTKARVLQMAEQLGYRPNLAAQALKLNRRLTVGVILPRQISQFFDPVRAGIRAAADSAVGMQVALEFYEYPRLGTGDIEAFEVARRRRFDGIIFLPGDARRFTRLIDEFAALGTAMMCVCSDAPESQRAGSVAAHASVSGGLAAELLSLRLQEKGRVAIITGELSTQDHLEKLRGFAAALGKGAPHLELLPPVESHEQPVEAYRQTLALMRDGLRPQGVYVSTANSMPVLRALEKLDLVGKVQVVTTDFFDELAPLIEAGSVLATIDQRPYMQGKLAFEALVSLLGKEAAAPRIIRLAPHVIFRSNLALSSAGAAAEGGTPGELLYG